ncbi:protein tyrosine phosphatase, putative [Plasmodium malariae]|uniref:Protein tyrosine phosphatase, putative n=1 Tax=Plasmodium malariae TaxID=5858 RepID=A0A1D3JKA0_PLAMA|nr:protein tyrosine phosphatase, putative [Plasmodium malariae]SBT86958.1 protein tyrosine phosphatase, putative [Plasmodium malariae]
MDGKEKRKEKKKSKKFYSKEAVKAFAWAAPKLEFCFSGRTSKDDKETDQRTSDNNDRMMCNAPQRTSKKYKSITSYSKSTFKCNSKYSLQFEKNRNVMSGIKLEKINLKNEKKDQYEGDHEYDEHHKSAIAQHQPLSTYQKLSSKSKEGILHSVSNNCNNLFEEKIFVSGYIFASDILNIQEKKITHIINAAGFECTNKFEGMFTYRTYYLKDDIHDDIFYILLDSFYYIKKILKKNKNHKILIQCNKGISRSIIIFTFFLMNELNINYFDAFDIVKKGRELSNPNMNYITQLLNMFTMKSAIQNMATTITESRNQNVPYNDEGVGDEIYKEAVDNDHHDYTAIHMGINTDSNPHMNRGEGSNPHMNRGEGSNPHMNRGEGSNPHMNRGEGSNPHMNRGVGSNPHMNRGVGSNPHMNRGVGSNPHLDSNNERNIIPPSSSVSPNVNMENEIKNLDHTNGEKCNKFIILFRIDSVENILTLTNLYNPTSNNTHINDYVTLIDRRFNYILTINFNDYYLLLFDNTFEEIYITLFNHFICVAHNFFGTISTTDMTTGNGINKSIVRSDFSILINKFKMNAKLFNRLSIYDQLYCNVQSFLKKKKFLKLE